MKRGGRKRQTGWEEEPLVVSARGEGERRAFRLKKGKVDERKSSNFV